MASNFGNCKGCGERIVWGKLKGKPHPFNVVYTHTGSLDLRAENSHFDTCANAGQFRRSGLRAAGDRDTALRALWKRKHFRVDKVLDRSSLHQVPLGRDVAERLAKVLREPGGPCCGFSDWEIDDITDCLYTAGANSDGNIRAVSADVALMDRIRRHVFGKGEAGSYFIAGVHVVLGDWEKVAREGNWGLLGPWGLELC